MSTKLIREMMVLLCIEVARHSISVRMELAADLPQVMGDRVQLQQVVMNLIMNSIDAMKDVEGTRELAIKSQRAENEQLWYPSAILASGCQCSSRNRSSSRFLQRSRMGPAWDFNQPFDHRIAWRPFVGRPDSRMAQAFISLFHHHRGP